MLNEVGHLTKSSVAILDEQRAFFRSKNAGCSFATVASHNMPKFGWKQVCSSADAASIDAEIRKALTEDETSTLSVVLPAVITSAALLDLLGEIGNSQILGIAQVEKWRAFDLYRVRAHFNGLTSWVTGFGPFEFLPNTRRAPHTELALRVAPRPAYDWYFTDYPADVIHLADMRMVGRSESDLVRLWDASFHRTARALGHKADKASAAKTTFAIPRILPG